MCILMSILGTFFLIITKVSMTQHHFLNENIKLCILNFRLFYVSYPVVLANQRIPKIMRDFDQYNATYTVTSSA